MNGFDLREETGFTVQNIVSTGELGTTVDLNAAAIRLGLEETEYDPEQFPGLIYRPTEHSVVLFVFANGKVIITGAPDFETAETGFEHLRSRMALETE